MLTRIERSLWVVLYKTFIYLWGYNNFGVLHTNGTRSLHLISWKKLWPEMGVAILHWEEGMFVDFEAWLKEKGVCDY